MMKNLLLRLQPKALRLVKHMGRLADQKGLAAYVVGGVVRDLILKRAGKDLDFVIEGDAIAFARSAAQALNGTLRTYSAFGTATLVLPGEADIDFVTARQEIYVAPGALPKVRQGDITDDLARRDFTVNAMALNINKTTFGFLYDPLNGLADLQDGVIRIHHERSFIDDPTRMYRVVRFEQRLRFRLSRVTEQCLKEGVEKKVFKTVTCPRLYQEFVKAFDEVNPAHVISRFHQTGLLSFLPSSDTINTSEIGRVLEALKRAPCQQTATRVKDIIGLMALGQPASFARACQISKVYVKAVDQSQKADQYIAALSQKDMKRSDVYFMLKKLDEAVVLFLWAKATDKRLRRRIETFLGTDRYVRLKIDGHTVKDVTGLSSRHIQEALAFVLSAKIDRQLTKKKEEVDILKHYTS